MNSVLITGADRGIGYAMCEEFLLNGWLVAAAQFMPKWQYLSRLQSRYSDRLLILPMDVGNDDSVAGAAVQLGSQLCTLDMQINCAGIALKDGREENLRTFNVNTLGPLRVTEAFLPMMDAGMKRLCYVSSEAGSIALAHRQDSFSYCMSKAALNMQVSLTFHRLRPAGYTFRLYHPGWVNSFMEGEEMSTEGTYQPEDTARAAYRQFTQAAPCEDILLLRDIKGETWSF